jgi:RNA-binding protein
MEELTGKQRRRLRAMAHALDPLIRIGKNGLTEGVTKAIERALTDHELIKIRYIHRKNEREELTALIAQRTQSHLIDQIGNTAILYRRSPEPSKREIKV